MTYDSSEANISVNFFSSSEEQVLSWITSVNAYNGYLPPHASMGKLFERYKLAEEFNSGSHAVLYGCVPALYT